MNEVGDSTCGRRRRAELLLAADVGREARRRPIHGRIESKGGGAGEPGPRLKLGAVGRAGSRRAKAPTGPRAPRTATRSAARGTPPPVVPHRSVLDREDRRRRRARVARLPGGAERGRHLRRVDRARPGPRGAGARRAAGGRDGKPRGGVAPRRREAARPRERGSDHAVARRPGEPGAERPGEAPVAGGPAAEAARPRAQRRPRMTRLTGNRDALQLMPTVARGRPPAPRRNGPARLTTTTPPEGRRGAAPPTPCTGPPRTTPPSRPS